MTLSARELHEVYPQQFARWIEEVVKVEGPVHTDGVTRRITEAAGVRRIGSRIEAAFAAGVREALRGGRIEQRGKFLSLRGAPLPKVRDRSELPNAYRTLELIAPEEIAEAVLTVVRASLGINLADVPLAVCRLLGFARTSEEMAEVVSSITKRLAAVGTLQIDEGHVKVASPIEANTQSGLRLIPKH